MPYYEYKCKKCANTVERRMSIKDEHPQVLDEPCDNCKDGQMERALSRTGFVLNGQGWARDSYT